MLLTNVGPSPVRLDYTFVGVRDPADENKDAEDENEGRTLASVETGGRIHRRVRVEGGSGNLCLTTVSRYNWKVHPQKGRNGG